MDELIKDKHPYLEDFAEVQRVEGITEEYVWYNSKLLINKMSSWQSEFEKVAMVMEARHKEHLKIISGLLDECKKLKDGRDAFDKYAGEANKKREWVGFTQEEHQSAIWTNGSFGAGFLLAEKLLKEKNA
jgi:hypothetical protein